ncbi:NUDIX hydrolase [Streptomyces sp. NPDC054835]|uniref:NUDIX hydrolase n=1 Tax=Streptomyces sp. NBC_01268 TaxID=2903806 RepID=UPI002E327C22|nr:NUDIX hydrolase [Streptomyces sp. NBC_01268]
MPPSVDHIRCTVADYLGRHPSERIALSGLLSTLDSGSDPTSRGTLPGHVTCSAVVLDADRRILHIAHRASGLLLTPGGHVDSGDDTLLAAALRELQEETGIPAACLALTHEFGGAPLDIDVHDIDARPSKGEPAHQHYDFQYVFRLTPDAPDLALQEEEIAGAVWLPQDEVRSPTLRMKLRDAALDGTITPVNASARGVDSGTTSCTPWRAARRLGTEGDAHSRPAPVRLDTTERALSSSTTNDSGTRPDLAQELLARAAADQKAGHQGDGPAIRRVDAANTAWLQHVVTAFGWPVRSLVGEAASEAAWLLAQHADRDPAFQESALALMVEAAAHGEVPGRHLAYLTDRCQVARGEAQTYGTQYGPGPDGRLALQRVIDPAGLDERRASVGLGPHAEYAALINERYGST